ncbi:MAG: N-acetylmuramoyl-L-alanine amidase [Anaeroplasma sp.]
MKRKISIIIFVICLFSVLLNTNATDENNNLIVIDPGHGGEDPGCYFNDYKESDINLELSFKIKEVLEYHGYDVILTRVNKSSLCEGKFIKKVDMEKRINVINSNNPLLCISIHMNSFAIEKYHGAQVFYSNANSNNRIIAEKIQNSLKKNLKNTDREETLRDNILLLNKVINPCVLIECGFMSNKEELNLLLSSDYQYKIAYAIYQGIK